MYVLEASALVLVPRACVSGSGEGAEKHKKARAGQTGADRLVAVRGRRGRKNFARAPPCRLTGCGACACECAERVPMWWRAERCAVRDVRARCAVHVMCSVHGVSGADV